MTAHTEEIARLVGTLKFNVESAGLQRFQTMLRNASQQMAKLGADYTKLANQITKGLKLKVDASQAEKAKTKLQQALDKELKAETALSRAKRDTFKAELQNQKWIYSGEKQKANLVTALVKDQQQHAVQQAKAYNALQQANGATKQQVASQGQLLALKEKQARLDLIHAKRQAITQKRDANHLLTQSKAQQIQAVTGRIVQQQQQQAIKHQAQMTSLAAATNAKQAAHNNAQTKFQWQSQRHAVWQANQAAKAAKAANATGGGFVGGMAGMMRGGVGGIGAEIVTALGPIGMALAAATAGLSLAVSKIDQRIEERKTGVIEAEQFNNTFRSISKNPEIANWFRDSFIKSQDDNGSVIDLDMAKEFRTLAMNQLAMGKSKDEIASLWNTRQSAFAVSGVSKADGKELNIQLGKMASDGTGNSTDSQQITDRMPMLMTYVVKEYMKAHNMKNKTPADLQKGLGAYNKDLKAGSGVKYVWFEEAMKNLVADNPETLDRNRKSVAANQERANNQGYLQANGINSSTELTAAMNENIKAHQDLAAAMKPVNEAMGEFDTWLTKVQAGFINLMLGKSEDGKETPRLKLGIKHRYKDEEPDYMKTFSKWMGLDNQESHSETLEGFNPKKVIQLDGFQQMAELYKQYESPSFSPLAAAANTNNTVGGTQINAPITVEGANIHIELNGSATEEDRQKMMSAVTAKLDETTAAMTLQIPEVAKKVFTDALGMGRAQQAERQ